MRPKVIILVLLATLAPIAFAHEVRPAYLELRQTGPETYDALWKVPGQGDLRLGLYVELPATCTNITEPRGSMINSAYTERWTVKCAGGLSGGAVHIAGLSRTATDVLVRLERLDGSNQITRVTPSSPAFVVEASPGRFEVVATYLKLGVEHILLGADHLLFVLGLLLIVKNRWMLLKTITAFTVAHSITLAIATFGYASAPVLPLNAAIALSILFLGPEIVRSWRGETSFTIRHPWVVAFCFGLLHGFGFASALTNAGLPRADLPLALLNFNVGVEIGQLSFVFLILAARAFLSNSSGTLAALGRSPAGLYRGHVGSLLDRSTPGNFVWRCAMTEKRNRLLMRSAGALMTMLLWAQVAFAHTQVGEAKGFLTGFKHPISGLDHVLAMVAVGLWGAQLGAPAIWILPVAFPMVMAFGGMLGLMGIPLPGVEYGIAASAILLGMAVLFEVRPPLAVAAALVGVFAIFHGHAHGTELPPGESGMLYSIGFVIATGCLHGVGISIGVVHRWKWGQRMLRVAGAIVAAGGVFFIWKALA